MTAAAEQDRTSGAGIAPTLARTRELAGAHNLIPLHQTFIDDMRDAGVGVPEAARADRPAFLLESAEQGRVGRYSFIGYRPRQVLRWSLGDPGDPYALAADALAAYRRCRSSRPAAVLRAAPSASSPTTSCARSSRSASPTRIRSACRTWR